MARNFALIGVAGYIAPRHLKAIKETGNKLVAALDVSDSVGILDQYFPDAAFFMEFERFDRYVNKLNHEAPEQHMHYLSVCSPNHLHDAHIRFAMHNHMTAICEKPLVLKPWNLDALATLEKETQQRVYTIMQLRLHPALIAMKEKIKNAPKNKMHEVDLTYITSRGSWYRYSWKGDENKSGGIAMNIGIHFFDLLGWLFGGLKENIVHITNGETMAGFLQFEQAKVRWLLSIDPTLLPKEYQEAGKRTYRSIQIDQTELEFGELNDLHTLSYQEILKGNGFGIDAVRPSIETVLEVNQAKPIGLRGEYHPLAQGLENA